MLIALVMARSTLPGESWISTGEGTDVETLHNIMITIPEQNLTISEHFCYKYFRRATGSPYTLVPEILRRVVDQLYYKYYVNKSLATAQERVHFMCAYCSHEEDEGPEKKHIKSIPKWYLKELYSTTKRVSNNLFL